MNEMNFSVQLMCRVRETVHISLGRILFIASAEPQGLSARFPVDRTTDGAGSEEKSCETPSKTVATRWQRSKEVTEETVSGVASAQARAPARREAEREFQALGPIEQKDRSPTAFSKSWHNQGRKVSRSQSTDRSIITKQLG